MDRARQVIRLDEFKHGYSQYELACFSGGSARRHGIILLMRRHKRPPLTYPRSVQSCQGTYRSLGRYCFEQFRADFAQLAGDGELGI
jgi:hypothetical protein